MPLTELKQDPEQEQYIAGFPKNFNPNELRGKKICYGASLKTENHIGNRLIASLELINQYKPDTINWFIACELSYLKEQIENPQLNENDARQLARANGDALQTEHDSLLNLNKEKYEIDYEFLRWYEFDNASNSINAIKFRESKVQIYFLYILGGLINSLPKNNQNLEIFYQNILTIFNKLFANELVANKDIIGFEEIFNKPSASISPQDKQYIITVATNFVATVKTAAVFKNGLEWDIILTSNKNPTYICGLAKELYNTVNHVATMYTENHKEKTQKDFKPFNRESTWLRSRDYALLDVAMIVTLAKTQDFKFLLYPLRQTKSLQNFFNIIRILCEPFDFKIIDIILAHPEQQKKANLKVLSPEKPSNDTKSHLQMPFFRNVSLDKKSQDLIRTLAEKERLLLDAERLIQSLKEIKERAALLEITLKEHIDQAGGLISDTDLDTLNRLQNVDLVFNHTSKKNIPTDKKILTLRI